MNDDYYHEDVDVEGVADEDFIDAEAAAEAEALLIAEENLKATDPGSLLKIENTLADTDLESLANKAISLTESYIRNDLAEDFESADADCEELKNIWNALSSIGIELEDFEEDLSSKIYEVVRQIEDKVLEFIGEPLENNK
jgi:hypothetical protein